MASNPNRNSAIDDVDGALEDNELDAAVGGFVIDAVSANTWAGTPVLLPAVQRPPIG
jgi:hypothetical protein